jgi:hypothetical protein
MRNASSSAPTTRRLEPGRLADVLLVKGDPLADIRVLA